MKRRLVPLLALGLVAVVVGAPQALSVRTPAPRASLDGYGAGYVRWFGANSPWNAPIPSGVASVPQSSAWIQALYASVNGINVNQRLWTPPVVFARKRDGRVRLDLENGWTIDDAPIPVGLAPSADADGHAVIIDTVHARAYDFFRLRPTETGGWTAGVAVVFRLSGSGWYNGRYCRRSVCGPWAARASGAALGGGLIRGEEVRMGVIPHALACAAPKRLIGPPVTPATTSDGTGGARAMPMGSRLQLDPGLDVRTLGLEPGEEIIARALQIYGAYVVDSSSSFACYARNVARLQLSPYPDSWSNGIGKDLLQHVRIVPPPAAPVYDSRVVFGQPHR